MENLIYRNIGEMTRRKLNIEREKSILMEKDSTYFSEFVNNFSYTRSIVHLLLVGIILGLCGCVYTILKTRKHTTAHRYPQPTEQYLPVQTDSALTEEIILKHLEGHWRGSFLWLDMNTVTGADSIYEFHFNSDSTFCVEWKNGLNWGTWRHGILGNTFTIIMRFDTYPLYLYNGRFQVRYHETLNSLSFRGQNSLEYGRFAEVDIRLVKY
jgi:hypothetical protein